MRSVIIALMAVFPLVAKTADQIVSIAYFDQDRVQFNIPEMPEFLKQQGEANAERGYMLFYERKMFDIFTMVSFYGGGNLGKYDKGEDTLYTASLFFASRLWIMHLLMLHPYIEASVFGPTILSKSQFALKDLKSNFLFQNTLSLGAEIGMGSGLSIEVKAVRYLQPNPSAIEPYAGVQVPILLSLGYLF